MIIDVHEFPLVARQTIHYLSSRAKEMTMSIGFTIEGQSDEELPEGLLGCVAINKPDQTRVGYV